MAIDVFLPVIFLVILIILTALLSFVGWQLFLFLSELRQALKRINDLIDNGEKKFEQLTSPFKTLGSFVDGAKSSIKAIDGFVSWLNKNQHDKKKD